MLKLKNENLTNICPTIYNELFSNRKKYNREQKIYNQRLPKINKKSFSPLFAFNEYKSIINLNQNSKRSNNSNNQIMTDRQNKNEHKNISTNFHFYYNKKNDYRKSNFIQKEKSKKIGLTVKNIELEENKDNKSKSIINNLYTLKDLKKKKII